MMNKTIKERIECLPVYAKLSKSFWEEVMHITIDLINLSPSASLDGDVLITLQNESYHDTFRLKSRLLIE